MHAQKPMVHPFHGVAYTQNDEILSRNSLRYMSEANVPAELNGALQLLINRYE